MRACWLLCRAGRESCRAGLHRPSDPPDLPVAQESGFGTLYPVGDLPPSVLNQLIADLRLQGDVLIVLWPDDARREQFPPSADYDGCVVEFNQREAQIRPFPPLMDDLALRLIDLDLFNRLFGRVMYIATFGNPEAALRLGFGLCLVCPTNRCHTCAKRFLLKNVDAHMTPHEY